MEINLAPNFTDQASVIAETALASNGPNGSYHTYPESKGGNCDVNGTDEYHDFYLTAQFVTGLIIYPILCITGIIGNSLSLIVLSHKDMATSTNIYLLALCISDSLKLLNDFLYFVMLVISQYNPTAAEAMTVNVYPYAHYVMQVAISVTAWLTVSVAFDRYVSVCFPSRAKSLCTIVRARMVVFGVFTTNILLSIPTVFRYRLQTINDIKNNQTCMELVVTELGRNREFMIPYTWVHNLLRGIIPVFILIFLNARIINVLRKERVKGKKFSSRNRITLMLIAMIVIFIVCITPDAIMSTFFGKGYVEEDFMVKAIREITDSLVTFNSAVNFILYCSLSVLFRNTFARLFLGRRFVRAQCGSCRQASTFAHGGGDNDGSGRRKSGGRLSLRMKHAEYTDLCEDSPLNSIRKVKSSNETKPHMDDTDRVFEESGGVWLGPVTSQYNYNCKTSDAEIRQTNSSDADRRTSESGGSKEDSVSESMPRPESNGTSTSGCYTAIDSSDKGSTPDDTDAITNTPIAGNGTNLDLKNQRENETTTPSFTEDEKKKTARRLAWKLDHHRSKEESPTEKELSLEVPPADTFCPKLNENGRSKFLISDSISEKERSLLQYVYHDSMDEGSLV